VVVGIPTVLAVALCCYQITSRSLGFDEAATVAITAQHGGALGSAIAHDGGNMSGYYVLQHVLVGLFGNGVFVLRLTSALATGATVAAVGMLAIRLFDRRVALAASLLSAVSLPLVFWGQSARGYAPMVAFVAASYVAFAVLVDRHAEGRSIRWPWILYVVLTTLAVYASFVAVLVIPAQLVSLGFYRRLLRPVASALAVCAAFCIPLVVLALGRGSGQLFWVPRPTFTIALQLAESLTSSGLEPNFHLAGTSWVAFGLAGVLIVLAAIAIGRGLGPGADRRTAWSQTLVLAWLVVPVALVWLESLVGQSIFLPRNLLMALPAVALLLALVLMDRRVPSVAGWAGLAVLLALRALQLAPSYGVSPEDWRTATAYVLAHAQPRDCVAFYPSDGRMAFEYYVGADTPASATAPRSVLPAVAWREVKPYVEDYATLTASELSRLPTECRRLWFVWSHEGQPDGPARSRANYARYRALRAALTAEFAAGATASFGYAAPVRVQLLAR
jgi:hypothetical protein